MRAWGLVLRADLRRRWRGLLLVALLLGIGAGTAMGATAGARRTATVMPRLLDAQLGFDALVNPNDGDADFDAVDALPDIEQTTRVTGVAVEPGDVAFVAAHDDSFGRDLVIPTVDEGRLPDPSSVDEAFVTTTAADILDVRVGDVIDAHVFTVADLKAEDPGTAIAVEVVGVGELPDQVLTRTEDRLPAVLLAPAFLERYDPARFFTGAFYRLRSGASLNDFVVGVQETLDEAVFVQTRASVEASADQSVAPYVAVLAGAAVVFALAVAVIAGQALARSAAGVAHSEPLLSAIGMGRGQRLAVHAGRAVVVGVAGAVIALVVAVCLSALAPVGPAGDVEPDPGIRLDTSVLLMGAALTCVFAIAVGLGSGFRAVRSARSGASRSQRPSQLAAAAARAGFGPTVVTGVRAALEPGERTRPGVRATIVAMVVSLVAVVAAATFAAGVHDLVREPRLYGGDWDLTVDVSGFEDLEGRGDLERSDDALAEALLGPEVATATFGGHLQASVDGESTAGIALDPGGPYPTLVQGTAAANDGEVVLGTALARRLGAGLGDEVSVRLGRTDVDATVVGTAVFPRFAAYPGADKTGLGEGIAVAPAFGDGVAGEGWTGYILLGLAPGADPDEVGAAIVERSRQVLLDADMETVELRENMARVSKPPEPDGLVGYRDLGAFPIAMAIALLLVCGGAAGHAIVSSVRHRRRELAGLRAMGLARSQVRWSVATQATTVTAVAILVGLPIGIAVGRVAWRRFAEQVGIVPEPTTPLWLLALVPLAVVLANVVAALPARAVAEMRPAEALRAE